MAFLSFQSDIRML